MPVQDDFENFRRQVLDTKKIIINGYRERLIQAIGFMYEELIRLTEENDGVDTGAYRSEHKILHDGQILFEHPDRAGPDTIYPSAKQAGVSPIFDALDRGDVEDAARIALDDYAVSKLGKITFMNERFYADVLEYGNSKVDARLIYARAGQSLRAFLGRMAADQAGTR